jgi:hypothetical protein
MEITMPHTDGGRESTPVQDNQAACVRKLNDQFRGAGHPSDELGFVDKGQP